MTDPVQKPAHPVDISNVSPKLPINVIEAITAIGAYIDASAIVPGNVAAAADVSRGEFQKLVSALNHTAA